MTHIEISQPDADGKLVCVRSWTLTHAVGPADLGELAAAIEALVAKQAHEAQGRKA